jgi:hypothetical protein
MWERAILATDLEQTRARARPATTPQVRPAVADGALEELEFHWGSAYHLAVIDGICTARRKDSTLTSCPGRQSPPEYSVLLTLRPTGRWNWSRSLSSPAYGKRRCRSCWTR